MFTVIIERTEGLKNKDTYTLEPGEKRPEQWKMIEEEHKDAICRFIYR